MNKYKAYIFDFDLTLADSSKGILICFKHTLAKFGYKIPEDNVIYRTIGLTLEDAFDVLTKTENNPNKKLMRKEYVAKADEVMVKNTFFYKDTISIMKKLLDNSLKVGIVSTKYRYRIIQTFQFQVGCHPYTEIIGGEDVSFAKPDPQGLNLMIERLGVEKSSILYVGDSYIDAQTAENAGVDFAGVTTGSTSQEDFAKFPSVKIGKCLADVVV